MVTVKHWLDTAVTRIVADDPQAVAETLLATRLGKNRAYLHLFPDMPLSDLLQTQLMSELTRLADGYPLAYLLGKKAFWDMDLTVTEATLIPRADTETLIEVAQTLFAPDTTAAMIDLGTGSGAIAIALSRLFKQAAVTATDISAAALAVAQRNAADWQTAPIRFVQTSWLQGFADAEFDLIAANPPYIAKGDTHLAALRHEPADALIAENHGLADIQIIIEQAQTKLKPNGWLLLEHGYDQGSAVRTLLAEAAYYRQTVTTYRDLGGNERITAAQRSMT